MRIIGPCLILATLITTPTQGAKKNEQKSDHSMRDSFTFSRVREWAKKFSQILYSTAVEATQVDELINKYKESGATVVDLDPEQVADEMKVRLEKYLEKRKSLAKDLKDQLEASRHTYANLSHDQLNHEDQVEFYRYYDAKNESNGVSIGRREGMLWVPPTEKDGYLKYETNPNFFNMQVDLQHAAVHVPTPIYPRNVTILNEIRWSGSLDKIFVHRRKSNFTSASWLFFCSSYGFMRFYPAAPWVYDRPDTDPPLDLYDCRTTEWYIDGATNSKNVVILLDVSGSMLGQRYEIAKKTINTILDTLSENDFFNIMTFNDETKYLYEPFNGRLMQATLRNKHIIRKEMERFKEIKNIAEYKRALPAAFQLLQKLLSPNASVDTASGENGSVTVGALPCGFENSTKQYGCNSAIMLITDGADQFFEDIFEQYNADKKIRFFSFLMGEDVTDFREVQWMACKNNGYFAHIANLADVQEKVQKYISVMTRPLAQHNETRAIWTGAYFDRLSMDTKLENISWYTSTGEERFKLGRVKDFTRPKGRRLVTTVAYPVIYNKTFLGVVGAAAPIAELQQRAPTYMLGANSYTFLVDNNGYIMFHPQLRPMVGFKPKPNYNSIDIMEVEVADEHEVDNETDTQDGTKWTLKEPLDYSHSLRTHLVDAISSKELPDREKVTMTVLYTMDGHDGLRRVYRQVHQYYYRGINNTLLSLGIAVPEGSKYRLEPPYAHGHFPLKDINSEWFDGTNWRLHPDWHYCRPNDSDIRSKEAVFRDYTTMMKKNGSLPEPCHNFDFLINRLLFDAKVTCEMDMCWIKKSKLDSKKGVMLAFLATQSGLTRFVDMNLADAVDGGMSGLTGNDTLPNVKCSQEEQPYMHFIERSTRAIDELFYRRALQFQEGEFVFDVNITNVVCLVSNASARLASMQHRDRYSVLITASRSVFLPGTNKAKAPLGVVGMEMLYISLGDMLTENTERFCEPGSGYICYLLDEHAWVVYSSDRRGEYRSGVSADVGRFFTKTGNATSAINNFLMSRMIDSIYKKVTYVDFQAMCPDRATTVSASSRILNPLLSIIRLIVWFFKELSTMLAEYSVWTIVSSAMMPAEAYLTSVVSQLREVSEGTVCDHVHTYYVLDRNFQGTKTLSTDRTSTGCGSHCKITAHAARIQKTNLVLVIYTTGATPCSILSCLERMRGAVDHGARPVYNATDKVLEDGKATIIRPRYRRAPSTDCYPMEAVDERDPPPCSRSSQSIVSITHLLHRFLLALLVLALSNFMLI